MNNGSSSWTKKNERAFRETFGNNCGISCKPILKTSKITIPIVRFVQWVIWGIICEWWWEIRLIGCSILAFGVWWICGVDEEGRREERIGLIEEIGSLVYCASQWRLIIQLLMIISRLDFDYWWGDVCSNEVGYLLIQSKGHFLNEIIQISSSWSQVQTNQAVDGWRRKPLIITSLYIFHRRRGVVCAGSSFGDLANRYRNDRHQSIDPELLGSIFGKYDSNLRL